MFYWHSFWNIALEGIFVCPCITIYLFVSKYAHIKVKTIEAFFGSLACCQNFHPITVFHSLFSCDFQEEVINTKEGRTDIRSILFLEYIIRLSIITMILDLSYTVQLYKIWFFYDSYIIIMWIYIFAIHCKSVSWRSAWF